MYVKAASELYLAGKDQHVRTTVLSELRSQLHDRKPDREQFILAVEERFFSPTNSRGTVSLFDMF